MRAPPELGRERRPRRVGLRAREVHAFARSEAKARGNPMSPDAADALVEALGEDLSAVDDAIERLEPAGVGALMAPYSLGPNRLRARMTGSCSAMMSLIAATNPGCW